MEETLKLPHRPPFCGDCGKPLSLSEGKVCLVDDCPTVGCATCNEISPYCFDHMELDPEIA